MTISQTVAAGLAGEKLSRVITGTSKVSLGRSIVAAGSGALVSSTATGSVVAFGSTLGASTMAAAAAPVVIPAAAVAATVSFVRSLWD